MYLLGQMYWKGEGVKVDKEKAYMFIWLAASSDVPGSKQDEAVLAQELQDKQLKKAQKKAGEWAKAHPVLGLRVNGQLVHSN